MAYVAVTGGEQAVKSSIALLSRYRTQGEKDLELEAIEKRMDLLIGRVMSEAGFYAPEYAALALKQSEGSMEEAVFLLRAYRSTLSRSYYSKTIDGRDMAIQRRISAAFKDIQGGQFLGATYDYTHRLLDFSLLTETTKEVAAIKQAWEAAQQQLQKEQGQEPEEGDIRAVRVSDVLRSEGLIKDPASDLTLAHQEVPEDITLNPLAFPAPRSARLQTLTRADTGYVSGLAYAGIRGFGTAHPTVGELRCGELEVVIEHPVQPGEELYVGSFTATEVEAFFSEADEGTLGIGLGYGLVFGRSDTKAIAMSILDYLLATEGDSILQNQEFVLLHGDCLEMNGFISHLKLPHYVTFQSKLDRVRKVKQDANGAAGKA